MACAIKRVSSEIMLNTLAGISFYLRKEFQKESVEEYLAKAADFGHRLIIPLSF